MKTILITGKTYPVRESLRTLGGVWDAKAKGWRVPASNAEMAQGLVDAGPAPAPRRAFTGGGSSRYRSHYAYFPSTGGEWYQNKAGRCEDSPACGCCS